LAQRQLSGSSGISGYLIIWFVWLIWFLLFLLLRYNVVHFIVQIRGLGKMIKAFPPEPYLGH
jgi:hypothetical protein